MPEETINQHLRIKHLGLQPYQKIWQAMSQFTTERQQDTIDELWLVEHLPVYTQGQAGKAEHILQANDIPIVRTDRGGQVTYHGPGQLVLYPLINLSRRKIGVREMVTLLEELVINYFSPLGLVAYARADAPGVYVNIDGKDAKIASLGLRVRRGCCFHGVAINIDMDLSPFLAINPCGHQGLRVTQLSELLDDFPDKQIIWQQLYEQFAARIGVTEIESSNT